MHTAKSRRAISHAPQLKTFSLSGKRSANQLSWKHKQAHVQKAVPEEQSTVPVPRGTHFYIDRFHYPGKCAQACTRIPTNKQNGQVQPWPQGLSTTEGSRGFASLPGARLQLPRNRVSCSPRCLTIPAAPWGLVRRALLLSETALQSYQQTLWHRSRIQKETMAIRPQNECLSLKTTNKQTHTTTNHTHRHKNTSGKSDIDRADHIIPGFRSDWHQSSLSVFLERKYVTSMTQKRKPRHTNAK